MCWNLDKKRNNKPSCYRQETILSKKRNRGCQPASAVVQKASSNITISRMTPSPIFEIQKHFWELCRSKTISPAQGFLYLFLVEECNRRFWENDFEVSNTLICATLSISEPTMIDARMKLKQLELIDFIPGVRKKCSPVYRLLYLNSLSINRDKTEHKPSINTGITEDKPSPFKRLIQDEDEDKKQHTVSPIGSVGKPTNYSEYIFFVNTNSGSDKYRQFLLEYKPLFPEPYMAYWNAVAEKNKDLGISSINTIQRRRKEKLLAIVEKPDFDFVKIIETALRSEVFMDSECFKFDWFINNEDNYMQILSGEFDDAKREEYSKSNDNGYFAFRNKKSKAKKV